MSDYIEVDYYLCGVYQGKLKVGKESICGAILSGDLMGGLTKLNEMKQTINKIAAVKPKKHSESGDK